MKIYNTKDWLNLVFKIHKSDTIQKLWPTVLLMGFFSWIVAYLEIDYFELSQNSGLKNMSVLHGVIGFVLSLLLVFRTNTAYDRWWEGRKVWGKLVNDSRNLATKLDALLLEDDRKNRPFFLKYDKQIQNQFAMFSYNLHKYLYYQRTKPDCC